MPRRTLALLTLLILPLVGLSLAPLAVVHAASYALLGTSLLPDSGDVKFPQVDTYSNIVSVSGNANKRDAFLWEKTDTAINFSSPGLLGQAGSTADYSTTRVIYSPGGSLFYFWANDNQRRIYMRVRLPGAADFGPSTTVLIAPGLPSHFDAVARSDHEAFLFWREFNGDRNVPLRYMVIGVSGNVPTPVAYTTLDSRVVQPGLRAASGPNGEVAVGYTLADGNNGKYQAHLAIWNGGDFTLVNVSEPNGEYTDPMPVITPDGKYFVTFRGVGTATDGTYYSERQTDGSWPIARLQKGETKWSSMVSDSFGNLHLFYMNYLSGGPRLYYVVKPTGQPFEPAFDAGPGNYFNVDGEASVRDLIYGHAVVEDFSGTRLQMRYFLFKSDLSPISASAISVDGGQQYTNKPNPPVAFSGVVGNQATMQVRYHWGAPPSDADPWTTFSNPLTVAAPTLAEPGACSEQTLYTQLRVGSALQVTPNQDTIIFDNVVQATADLVNPNGAYDPGYTASPQAVLKVNSPYECIGISGSAVSGDLTPASQSIAINGNRYFQTTLNLAGGEGQKTVTVSVTDLLGNSTGNTQKTITYDATKPLLTDPGTVTITPDTADPLTNIFAQVEIDGAQVTDDRGLYGLLLQNALTPTGGSPVAGIVPAVVPFSAMRQVTTAGGQVSLLFDWNLLSGIPAASIRPGAYSFTAYFVDRAGNRTDALAVQSAPITLTTVNLIKVELPLVRR